MERAVVMSPSKTLTVNVLPEELLSCTEGTATGTQRGRKTANHYGELRQAVEKCCETSEDLALVRDKLSGLVEETLIRKLLSEAD